jgi:hypothetical protein
MWDVIIGQRTRPENSKVDHVRPESSENEARQKDPNAAKIFDEQKKFDRVCTFAGLHIIGALSDGIITSSSGR